MVPVDSQYFLENQYFLDIFQLLKVQMQIHLESLREPPLPIPQEQISRYIETYPIGRKT